MAFASVGTLGTGLSSGNNQSTLDITTSATGEVGNLVVVAVAVDNPTGTGGASTAVSSITDNSGAGFPGGNTWTRAVGFTNTNGGAAQDGADISIWYTVVAAEITSGDIIRATFANATTSDATAMSAWEFTIGAGSGVVVEATNTLANDAAAAGSLDATTANIACLRFRAIASESNSSTALTKTAAFDSLITQAVSGAGTSATEMGVRGEFDISTGTGSASAPTGGAGAVDNASAYVAFKETTAHVGEARFAGAGSLSVQAVKQPSEATFAGAGAICPSSFTALLHFDGADASQTITDAVGHVWTAVNDAQLDNAQAKFGTTAALFDGATDYILGDGSQDFAFGTGDFTIDLWYRPDTLAANHILFDWRSTNQTNNFQLGVGTDGSVFLFQEGSRVNAPVGTIVVDAWHHVALVRASNVHTVYVNGIAVGSTHTTSQSYGIEANRPVLGAAYSALGDNSVLGWIDEFTVRRRAVWTSNFTPPSSAYVFDGGLIVTQNMAAQERLGGTGSFSAEATITSAGGTTHVGEVSFKGGQRNFEDNFNRAGPSLGTNWTTTTGFSNLEIQSSTVAGASVLDAHCSAFWSADLSPNNQFSQFTIAALTPGTDSAFLGLTLRHQAGDTDKFYIAFAGTDNFVTIFKVVDGTFNAMGGASAGTINPGDVFRFEVSGTGIGGVILVARINGSIIHSFTDTNTGGIDPYDTGSPGFDIIRHGTATATVDNWSGGALIGAFQVSADVQRPIAAIFAGAGLLSLLATVNAATYAVFQGAGLLSAEELLLETARATFAGAGSVSVDITVVTAGGTAHVGEARFAGAGNLSAQPQLKAAALATFQGVGNFSAYVQNPKQSAFILAGSGSLSVNAIVKQAVQATFQGAGSLSPLVSQAWATGAILVGVGNASFHGMQLKPLVPDGDSSTGGWLNEVDSLPLFPSLDEIVPLDADYIKSSAAPAVDICVVSLSNPTTATLVAPVSILYRYGKSGTDTAALQVRLLQGTTTIATWQHNDIASGFVTVEQFLDGAMIANITDWNDLFLEFQSGTITTHMGRAIFDGSGAM